MVNVGRRAMWLWCVAVAFSANVLAEDAWPLPWEIVDLETERGHVKQMRVGHVVYPRPASEEALRLCVRQVYRSLRSDILASAAQNETTNHVVSVHVYWDRREHQLCREYSFQTPKLAFVSISQKGLPAKLADKQIEIKWRDPASEPPERAKELEFAFWRLFDAHLDDWKLTNRPSKGVVPQAVLLAEMRFEELLPPRVFREASEDFGLTENLVRRSAAHVSVWRDGLKATDELIEKRINEQRASEASRAKKK